MSTHMQDSKNGPIHDARRLLSCVKYRDEAMLYSNLLNLPYRTHTHIHIQIHENNNNKNKRDEEEKIGKREK